MFAIEIHLHLMKLTFVVLVSIFWITVPAQPPVKRPPLTPSPVKRPPLAPSAAKRPPLEKSAIERAIAEQSSMFPSTYYPQQYFRDPLAIPISLAANFGELRADHYHMGLDIRTQHRENLPVFAAADGYVARVQIGPFGFGQAIYVQHPNGYTTVYGHLNRFFPALAAYVEKQQYRQESWAINLEIPPSLFPVRQGQQIAWSGSTGGSQGPHLHFEIRSTRDGANLNPLLFGLPVPDKNPPEISRLAWYDGNKGIYDQSAHILPVHIERPQWSAARAGHPSAGYELGSSWMTVPVSRIGFSISASDAQTGSTNPNGIYRATLYDNGQPVIGFQMDHISYDDTRNINAHIDYKTRELGGPFLQELFILPGYPFPSIYRVPGPAGGTDPAAHASESNQRQRVGAGSKDGMIDLSDGLPHKVLIVVTDTRGNDAHLAFTVQYRPETATVEDSAGAQQDTAGTKRFYPGMVDGIETADYAFFIGERSLYDSADIGAKAGIVSDVSLPGALSGVYTIGSRYIPLLGPVLVRLRLPDSSGVVGFSGSVFDTGRIVMVCTDGDAKDVQRPEWRGAWASARFGEFGDFQLVYDTIPPVITPIGPLEGADLSRAGRIALNVQDNLGGVRHFRAELDGHWLCFTNDKGRAWIYKFDRRCTTGSHVLKVAVEDVAGNRTEQEYHFSR